MVGARSHGLPGPPKSGPAGKYSIFLMLSACYWLSEMLRIAEEIRDFIRETRNHPHSDNSDDNKQILRTCAWCIVRNQPGDPDL